MLSHSDYCEEYMTHIFPAVTLDRGRLPKRVTHHHCGDINPRLLDQIAPLTEYDRRQLANGMPEPPVDVQQHVAARITEVRRQVYGA